MDLKAILIKLGNSPKFLALLAGLVATVLTEFGVGISEEFILEITILLSGYMVGKGIEGSRAKL